MFYSTFSESRCLRATYERSVELPHFPEEEFWPVNSAWLVTRSEKPTTGPCCHRVHFLALTSPPWLCSRILQIWTSAKRTGLAPPPVGLRSYPRHKSLEMLEAD